MSAQAEIASSRLDKSVLRYVLLHTSRMNMLALERQMQGMRGPGGRLRLESGAVRSEVDHRIAVTLQLAVEVQLADPDIARWVSRDQDGLRRQMAIDAAYFPTVARERELQPPKALKDTSSNVLWSEFEKHMLLASQQHDSSNPKTSLAEERKDEVSYLKEVAFGVFQMLRPSVRASDWRSAALSRAGPLLRRPAPEVFDALLLSKRSLVNEQGLWRWPEESTSSSHAETEKCVAYIEQQQQALALELGALVGDQDFSREVFELLAEGVRLLPTSPAPAAVSRAVMNFWQRGVESVSEANLRKAEDSALLQEFADTLIRSEGALVKAIASGAFFGELANPSRRGEEPPAEKCKRGLVLLSEGLNFGEKAWDEIELSLDVMAEGVSKLSKRASLPAMFSSSALGLKDLSSKVKEARNLARNWVEVFEHQGWVDSQERLERFARSNVVSDASAAELFCAAQNIGPGRLLSIDPRKNNLQDWSHALVSAIQGRGVPPWLAGVALRRLGIETLTADFQRALFAAVARSGDTAPLTDGSRATLNAAPLGSDLTLGERANLLKRTPSESRSLIVIRKNDSTSMKGWIAPPPNALVLILTSEEAWTLLKEGSRLLRALPRPIQLEFEETEDLRLVERLNRGLRQVFMPISFPIRTPLKFFTNTYGTARLFRGEDFRSAEELLER